VRATAVAFEHPLSGGWTSSFTIEGREAPREGEEPEARVRPVMPGYFRTVGVRLLRGRDVSDRDVFGAPGAVVINQAFARRHFPGADPIGQRIRRGGWWPGQPSSFEIVGVVSDERFLGPQRDPDPATYFPHAQFPMNDMYLIVRTAGDPLSVAGALRRTVWAIDRDLPLERLQTMEQILAESVAGPRFNTWLVAVFAGVALALAAVGIYGVLSYTVTQRSGEMGIRMALGAQRAQVVRLVVGHGMMLALLGVTAGLGAALLLTRVLTRLLYGVSTTDPATFATVALVLTVTAFAAAYLPARRAARVDPLVALRGE
jgi:putative ABC transport system permease protein